MSSDSEGDFRWMMNNPVIEAEVSRERFISVSILIWSEDSVRIVFNFQMYWLKSALYLNSKVWLIWQSFGERATRLRSNSSLSKKGRSDFLLAETREGGASAKNHVLNVNYFSPDVTSHQSTAVYKNFVNELQDFEPEVNSLPFIE